MRWCRIFLLGFSLAGLAIASGCATTRPPAPITGCDRSLDQLLPLLGTCDDLQTAPPGRPITLSQCIGSALKNGRVGEESLRVRSYDASLALMKATGLKAEVVWLTLEQATQNLVLAVETAYWNLALAREMVVAREQALAILDEEAAGAKTRYDEQLLTRQDLEAVEEQRQVARVDLLEARARAMEAERSLRRTAGLPPHDGTSLVPADVPKMTAPVCDPKTDLENARQFRPELTLARVEAEIAGKELAAIRTEKERPAALLRAEREQAALRNAEDEMIFALQKARRQTAQAWQSTELLEARSEAARRRYEAVKEKWQSKEFGDLREWILAQTGLLTAKAERFRASVELQQARAELLRHTGMLLRYHQVCIAGRAPRPTPGD